MPQLQARMKHQPWARRFVTFLYPPPADKLECWAQRSHHTQRPELACKDPSRLHSDATTWKRTTQPYDHRSNDQWKNMPKYSCHKIAFDWLILFAFPHVKHIEHVSFSGAVKTATKSKWAPIFWTDYRERASGIARIASSGRRKRRSSCGISMCMTSRCVFVNYRGMCLGSLTRSECSITTIHTHRALRWNQRVGMERERLAWVVKKM
ncbi:hypothetical protein CC86DRAFT_434546 [Ophiobolus disseminans]|uniref:Uncharacterized protein n=1 Tax=Ophiobolus disseminans TaxID=1469910 RepID=A0A6A7ABI6_9PLEO|nr:hypothetical protein CC86DRAFT_434546 [Ophiobolus disseminans]